MKCRYLILFVLCICALFSCSRENSRLRTQEFNQWMENNGKIKVLSTIAMISDLVSHVGGEHVEVLTLIQGELDPHSYQLVKGDSEKFLRADLIFYNGLGLEHGASLQSYLQGNEKAIALGDKVKELHPVKILNEKGQIDPHIWMDVSLWSETLPAIVDELSKLDPDHALTYRENGERLKAKMLSIHNEMKNKLNQISEEKRYLVTSHDAFNYFTRAYLATDEERETGDWKKRFVAPEGLAPESQLSSRELLTIIDHLKAHQVHILFPESNVSKDSIRKIVEAGNKKGLTLKVADKALFGDAMGKVDSTGDNYLKMMQHNTHAIIQNWNEEL